MLPLFRLVDRRSRLYYSDVQRLRRKLLPTVPLYPFLSDRHLAHVPCFVDGRDAFFYQKDLFAYLREVGFLQSSYLTVRWASPRGVGGWRARSGGWPLRGTWRRGDGDDGGAGGAGRDGG